MQRKLIILLIILGGIVQFSEGSSKKQEELSVKKLHSAPDTVTINGRQFVLDTYLWRDFMPISPPKGKPLRAVVTIGPTDNQPFPQSLNADKIWVIHGEDLWTRSLEKTGGTGPPGTLKKLEMMSSGGPKWGPGIEVSVVVQLKDSFGDTYLLKADNQPIHRTE